jgi:hypothetical protein
MGHFRVRNTSGQLLAEAQREERRKRLEWKYLRRLVVLRSRLVVRLVSKYGRDVSGPCSRDSSLVISPKGASPSHLRMFLEPVGVGLAETKTAKDRSH